MDHSSPDDVQFPGREEAIAGVELSVRGLQDVARRQLLGSIVVAILIAGVAGLAAMQPSREVVAARSGQISPTVWRPTFATPTSQNVAAVKRKKETP
jgi:hypothetical protein